MDGITSFVDRLQSQQPLRNAVRGLLGMPRRRSNVIDPMEEQTARDREMGGDISNPFPQQKRFPVRQVQATQELPAPAATSPIETIPTPPPVDETQPFKGQSIFQAMFRTPQDGVDAQRKAAGGAMPTAAPANGGTGLSAQIAAINAAQFDSPADKLDAHANLMSEAAAMAAYSGNKEAQQTLMRVAEAYAQRGYAMRQMELAGNAAKYQMETQGKVFEYMKDAPRQFEEATVRAGMALNEEDERTFNRRLAVTKQLGSTATSFADFEAPLVENPGLSVEEYAAQMAGAIREAAAAGGKTADPAAVKAAYDNAYRTGTRVRVGQYIAGMMDGTGPDFDDTHPGFVELQSHFARRLAENPEEYDAIRADLISSIAPAVRASAVGVPPQDQAEYIRQIIEGDGGEGRGLLGPKVESSWSIF